MEPQAYPMPPQQAHAITTLDTAMESLPFSHYSDRGRALHKSAVTTGGEGDMDLGEEHGENPALDATAAVQAPAVGLLFPLEELERL